MIDDSWGKGLELELELELKLQMGSQVVLTVTVHGVSICWQCLFCHRRS